MPGPSLTQRFEKLYTLSATGVGGNSFTYTLPASITIGNKFEIALVSADLAGFKTKAYHQFKIDLKNEDVQGKTLYAHSGKWSATEDNTIDIHERIYRKFICGTKELTALEIEIRNKSDNQLVPTLGSEGSSFITVHIRHCVDELSNEFAEATKDSCNVIASAHVALKAVADNIFAKLEDLKLVSDDIENKLGAINTVNNAIKDNILLVKGSQDLANGLLGECKSATIAVQTHVDNASSAITGSLSGVQSMTEQCRNAVQDGTVALNSFAAFNAAAHADLKTACETIDSSTLQVKVATEGVQVMVNNASSAITGSLSGVQSMTEQCRNAVQDGTVALNSFAAINQAAHADLKLACETIDSSTLQVKVATEGVRVMVNNASSAITGSLSGVQSMTEQCRNAVQDGTVALNSFKAINQAAHADLKSACETIDSSTLQVKVATDGVGVMVNNASSAITGSLSGVQSMTEQVRNAVEDSTVALNGFKAENASNHTALLASTEAVKSAADSIAIKVEEHKAISSDHSSKIRYKLVV